MELALRQTIFVEMIILHLPPRVILATATRVSRFWKAVIDGSPSIKGVITFAPESLDYNVATQLPGSLQSVPAYLEKLKINNILEKYPGPDNDDWQPTKFWVYKDSGHMVLFPMDSILPSGGTYMIGGGIWRTGTSLQFESSPSGSWRKMFLTNAPCERVVCRFESEDATPEIKTEFSVEDPEGVRIGLIDDAVQRALASQRQHGGDVQKGPAFKLMIIVNFIHEVRGAGTP